jgi:hypothetical protein
MMYAHSSGLGLRVLCRSLVQSLPRTGCSSSISFPSTNEVGRNASNGWSRKNCFLNLSSKYAISSGFSAILAGFFRERGRSNSEREGGALAGRGKGGWSSTAWNHAGSRFKYPALSKREACLCTWEATRLTIGGVERAEEDFAWQRPRLPIPRSGPLASLAFELAQGPSVCETFSIAPGTRLFQNPKRDHNSILVERTTKDKV